MSLEKARALFVELVANVPPEEWDARLEELAGGDEELRRQVGRILAAHREAGSFLESPAPTLGLTTGEPPASAGAVLGPYKLLEQIGEGGFGVVFLAEQTQPVRRKVALKVLKPGMDSRQVVARFEAERQALALMEHPNIAKVFDGGATAEGRPYFVMELVKGVPITQFCDEQRLPPRERLELFVQVCAAVQHAHQKGVIHRDLKPSNILVSRHDTTPVVKVIDFGIAKALGQELTDKTLFTGVAQMVGTPLYMSPEQAGMSDLDVDTRSDVYSLGVLLYELLTGTTPFTVERFRKAAYDEIRRVIREEEPPKPSTRLSELGRSCPAGRANGAAGPMPPLAPASSLASVSAQRQTEPAKLTRLVRGELDWIVMQALEKDRNRRYETVNGFAADVLRYLADEPVLACPPAVGYRLRKFVRRNKAALAAAGLVLAALVTGTAVSTWQAVRATAAEKWADETLQSERRARADLDAARGERDRQQARTNRELGEALADAAGWREKVKTVTLSDSPAWNQLREAMRRAEALASSELADSALVVRVRALAAEVRQGERDRRMIARVEGIRLERGFERGDQLMMYPFDTFPAYDAAFREYGILLPGSGTIPSNPLEAGFPPREVVENGFSTDWERRVTDAARLIAASPIREMLVAALDDCAGNTILLMERLLPVALRVEEGHPWRRRYFSARVRNDRAALARLAREPEALDQPPAILVNVARAVGMADRAAAVELLREAQRRHPADVWINLQLAGWTPPGESAGFRRAALAARPESVGIRHQLAGTLYQSGQHDEAVAVYRQAIRLKPDDLFAYTQIGFILRAKKDPDPDGALAAWHRALEIDPGYGPVLVRLAVVRRAEGDPVGAAAFDRRATERDPKAASETYLNLAAELGRVRNDIEEEIACRKAVELDPASYRARYRLAYFLHGRKRWDEAAAAYRKTIDLLPRYVPAYLGLGSILSEKKLFDEAADVYRRGVAMDPRDARLHERLGDALAALGRVPGAVAAYRKALALEPDWAQAHYNLGNALEQGGDLPGAIAAYDKAIALKPGYAEAHCNRGHALRRQGEFRNALAALRRGHELGSKDRRWAYPSAQWVRQCERLVELDERLPGYLEGKTLPAGSKEWLELAELCALKRLFRAAVRFYEEAFDREPKLAELLNSHRYNAACAAALAGCGLGLDTGKLDNDERARLRKRALAWLRADLEAWGVLLDREPVKAPSANRTLRYWQDDSDLAVVRGAGGLAKLPDGERMSWEKLWGDVAALSKKAADASAAPKPSDSK